MKQLLSLLAISTLIVTSTSSCKPLLTNNSNHRFKLKQENKQSNINDKNKTNPLKNKVITSGIINNTLIMDNNVMWVATNQGLYMSSNDTDFKNVFPKHIIALNIKINGTIYVGTNGDGLYNSTNGSEFTKITNGIASDAWINAIAIATDETIYVGTDKGLYQSSDGTNFKNIFAKHITALDVSLNKTIFIGTNEGLYQSNDNNIFNKIQTIANDTYINAIKISPNNFIYVIASNGPFYNLYQSIDGSNFNKTKGIPNYRYVNLITIDFDLKGNIYVGTNGKGLYQSSDGTNFQQLPLDNDLNNEIISKYMIDKYHNIYLGTANGLWKIDLIDNLLTIKQADYIGKHYDGLVYKNEQLINIKAELLANATLDNKKLTLPANNVEILGGQHTLLLTLKNKYQQYLDLFVDDMITGQITYKLWVKTAIAKDKINYTTNVDDINLLLGLVSNLGNTNNAQIIQTKTKQGSGSHPAILSLKVDDTLINYATSFYVQGNVDSNNNFTETSTHQTFAKSLMITSDGIYHLHLVDMIGNVYNSYLELGQSNWKLQGIFNNEQLNQLSNKLNVSLNLTDQEQLAQATGWLTNYDKFSSNLFVKSLQESGKGFDQNIKKELKNDFKWFLKPLKYEPNNEPKFDDGLDKDALVKTINNKANEILKNELNNLPQNLNIDTTNIANKSTLTSYRNWINNYQKFINDNKDSWSRNIANIAGRGYAKDDLIAIIKNYVKNNFNKYLQHVVWNPITSNDYQQFIELDKLQSDTIDWVSQNYSDINQNYQQAMKAAESGLNLHGYSITDILNGKQLPQTKDEIEHFASGQSFHYWLQNQANIKFHHWQLTIGFSIAIPLFAIAVIISATCYWKFSTNANVKNKKQ